MPNSYDNLMKYGVTNAFAIMVCAFTVPAAKLGGEYLADAHGYEVEMGGLIGTGVGLAPLAVTLLLTAYGLIKDYRENKAANEENASLLENDELNETFQVKETPRQSFSLFRVLVCGNKTKEEKELGGLRPDFHA